jgi:anti-sigma factor RsiW
LPSRADHSPPTAGDLADLSALADGTLDPARQSSVEAHIAASPQLSALYERERRVVAALHQASASERAPADLRARIEAARPKRATATRRRFAYGGAVAGALAAAALALALILPSGTPGAPSVSDAAALAARGATQGAPAPDPARPGTIRQNVGEVYFPNWSKAPGWRAVGARTDTLGGHKAVTVYYQGRNARVAYTIVARPPLKVPPSQRTVLNGTKLWTYTADGRLVVAWREEGNTCVLSAKGVSPAELQRLAAWAVPAENR